MEAESFIFIPYINSRCDQTLIVTSLLHNYWMNLSDKGSILQNKFICPFDCNKALTPRHRPSHQTPTLTLWMYGCNKTYLSRRMLFVYGLVTSKTVSIVRDNIISIFIYYVIRMRYSNVVHFLLHIAVIHVKLNFM